MRTILFIILFFAIVISAASSRMEPETKSVSYPETEKVFKYGEPDGIELTYDFLDQDVRLRLFVTPRIYHPDEKDYCMLRKEVERLTSGKKIALGNTGYSVQFMGGSLHYSPFTLSSRDYAYEYLIFSEDHKAKLIGKTIYVYGSSGKEGFNFIPVCP